MAGGGAANDRQPAVAAVVLLPGEKRSWGTLWKFHIYTSYLRYNRQ